MTGHLTILKGVTFVPALVEGTVTFEDVKGWIRSGRILRHLFRYRVVRLRTHQLETLPKPLLTAIVMRSLSRGACRIEDESGRQVSIGVGTLTRYLRRFLRDALHRSQLIRTVESDLLAIEASTAPQRNPVRLDASPVYIRTDLVYGIQSGGSIGHIAGVLNTLDTFTGSPVLLTTDRIPTVRDDIETHVILPREGFDDFAELPGFAFNKTFGDAAERLLAGRDTAFVYQRYSANNYAGARLARRLRVPFVLEYNGSEIWINRHWGRPLKYEALSTRIEDFDLGAADVVVVVSTPMLTELTERGVDPEKVLVNPNGVDPDRYSPAVDGGPVRERLGLQDATVIGFIGTFGPWHGAEVLADAFAWLLGRYPGYRGRVRLLMIGDGPTLPETLRRLDVAGIRDEVTFVGRTSQEDGPAHMAACDILVSPHVPNADGTPFFGSPTKLFEYMAMGKGIVASRLEQIGEVLEHEQTALLVAPGDVDALAGGIRRLIEDPALRARLGSAARADAVANHTWRQHTGRIIEKLQSRCA